MYVAIEGNDDVNAGPGLERIGSETNQARKDERRILKIRFDDWLAHGNVYEYHHAADRDFPPAYEFRWDFPAGRHNRLYGFLTKPRTGQPRFEVCVLCCHRAKKDKKTDPAVKRLIIEMANNDEVNEAVRRRFNRKGGRS